MFVKNSNWILTHHSVKEFLKLIFLEFINSCLKLASASNYEEKLNLSREIIEKFITKDSPNEIPIPEEDRKNLFEQFKILSQPTDTEGKIEYVVEGYFDDIFDKIKEVQFIEMYRDVFPRYIRSKKCIPMLSKYMDDPNVVQSKQSVQFPYQNSDFKRQYLTQMDFDFMKSLAKDDLNWELSLIQSLTYTKISPIIGGRIEHLLL
jgi:hypothetical protein